MNSAGAQVLSDECRRLTDRRSLSWRTFVQGTLTPRRMENRRGGEHEWHLDWHEPHLLFLAVVILLLSVTDAFLTLKLIAMGAHEANPVMDYLLQETPQLFVGVKMALTGMGVVILTALARARLFQAFRTSAVIHTCMLGYVALIVYEAWLFRQLM